MLFLQALLLADLAAKEEGEWHARLAKLDAAHQDTEAATRAAAYAPHPTPTTQHPTPYTLHPTPNTQHPTPYTPHPTPSTLHPTPNTLHPTPSAAALQSQQEDAALLTAGWKASREQVARLVESEVPQP